MTDIRHARPGDCPGSLGLIQQLAEYERAPDQVRATVEDLTAALFPESGEPAVHCFVAEDDGELVGMALWFVTFSTWEGRHGMYLEDLFVVPQRRGERIGERLLATLAATCVERGYPRLEWSVLDWNEPAIGFYRSLGAVGMDDWTVHRLTAEPIARLAQRADAPPA